MESKAVWAVKICMWLEKTIYKLYVSIKEKIKIIIKNTKSIKFPKKKIYFKSILQISEKNWQKIIAKNFKLKI